MENIPSHKRGGVLARRRRFRDAANGAYPEDMRNADQQRILIKAYARGLEDDEIAKELMTRGKPRTTLECLERTAEFDEHNDQYARLGHREKGMDVNVVAPTTRKAVSKTHKPDSDEDEVRELLKRIVKGQDRLHTRITKIEQTSPVHTFTPQSHASTHNQYQTSQYQTYR